jgi:TM2 domain-containing membrane protein YozV
MPGGQILCEPCQGTWHAYPQPFVALPSGPNPAAAAVLGLIPGVGAMYNGQFFKGLIHVVIFAVLITLTDHYGIFGLFIAAWILYQSFEAYHTAKAMRDGEPLPDPLGLNEVGNWLNLGGHPRYPGPPQGSGPTPNAYPGTFTAASYGPAPGAQGTVDPAQPHFEPGAWQTPYNPPPPGSAGPTPAPPGFTPDPSGYWQPMFARRREPVGAIVLIGLGVFFLLGQLDVFHGYLLRFSWPVVLIAVGIWQIVRRLGDFNGGSK